MSEWFRRGLVLAGLVVLVAAAWPSALGDQGRVGMVAGVMALWWLMEPLPRPMTAALPLLFWPLLGIRPLGEVAAWYAHPLLMLMAAGFVLGFAMSKVALHRRITAWLLSVERIRTSPRATLMALMCVGACLSAVVSNSATMVMMLPLATALAERGGEDPMRRKAFALGLAYACSLGGMMTLVGTPPNAVLAGMSPSLGGPVIGFANWLAVGVPLACALLPIVWWMVVWELKVPGRSPELSGAVARTGAPWAPGERAMLAIVALAMFGWLTRRGIGVGDWGWQGWGAWVDAPGVQGDAWVALAAATACFLVVGPRNAEGRRTPLLNGSAFTEGIAWPVLLVMGGGFALADAMGATGLDATLARGLTGLEDLPPLLILPLMIFGVSMLTELTSNTATAQLLLPIVAATATQIGAPLTSWMVATTLATSCAFMMPVATPPNAIAAEAAGVDGRTMARVGWRLNLISAFILALGCRFWVPLVLG